MFQRAGFWKFSRWIKLEMFIAVKATVMVVAEVKPDERFIGSSIRTINGMAQSEYRRPINVCARERFANNVSVDCYRFAFRDEMTFFGFLRHGEGSLA